MNISNLELNIKYKSYRKICTTLEEKIKSGASKRSQLSNWSRYFEYFKEGYGFIVKKIYDTPKPKIDNRGKSKGSRGNYLGIYSKYLDPLLENYFYSTLKYRSIKDNTIYISNDYLAESIHMINSSYRICKANRKKFHRYLYGVHSIYSYRPEDDVFNILTSKIRSTIISSLDRLQKQNKIVYIATNIVIVGKQNRGTTVAEDEYINEVEAEVMEEMEISKEQKNWNTRIRQEFYEQVNAIVLEKLKVNGYYKGYEIEIINVKDQDKIEGLQNEVNKLFIESIKKSIKNQVQKSSSKQDLEEWDQQRLQENYITNIHTIIDILVNSKTSEVKYLINNMSDYIENVSISDEWGTREYFL